MSEDQEMLDVEVVDVETEEEMVKQKDLEVSSVKEEEEEEEEEEEDMENIENVENIVVIATDSMDVKEEENGLTIVEENVEIEEGLNITVKEEEQDIVDGTSIENNEGKDGDPSNPANDCGVPTFADVHRPDFVEKTGDESESVAIPVRIEPLNKDDNEKDVTMEIAVEVAEEGEKRKRKRVPRKIQKTETNENGEPIDNKPYKCEECHWQFKQRYRFKRHMRTHTGERPYKCPECEKQFSRSHILKVHMMIHTGEKPFRCEECGWSFMKKYHLQRHMRTHTGEMPFVCQECGVHFSRQYYLKKHLVSTHGAKIDVKTEKADSKSAPVEGIVDVIENSEKNCIEVVCTIELDPSKEQDCNSIPDEMEVVGETDSSNQNGSTTYSNDENCLTDHANEENGLTDHANDENGLADHSNDENGSEPKSEQQNGGTVHLPNQYCSTINSANQNGSTINSAIQNGSSEASLKECIEMVNHLVEKSMEPIVTKCDVVANVPMNMNNETESHIDVDFHTIPVK